jgi:hypothetical protein
VYRYGRGVFEPPMQGEAGEQHAEHQDGCARASSAQRAVLTHLPTMESSRAMLVSAGEVLVPSRERFASSGSPSTQSDPRPSTRARAAECSRPRMEGAHGE